MDLVGFVSKTVLTFLPTTSAREVMQSPLSVCVHPDNFWNEWPLTPFACTVYGFDHDGSEIHTMPHFHCPARLHRNTEVRRQIRVSCSSKLSGTSVLHRGQFSNCLSKCKKMRLFTFRGWAVSLSRTFCRTLTAAYSHWTRPKVILAKLHRWLFAQQWRFVCHVCIVELHHASNLHCMQIDFSSYFTTGDGAKFVVLNVIGNG